MKRLMVLALACAGVMHAQLGQTTDWFTFGGNAQRDGWEKGERKFVKDDVKDFQLLWQHRLVNSKPGVGLLLPPVVIGNLIGYRGFKELAIVAGSNDNLIAIDADLDRLYWDKHINDVAEVKKGCNANLTSAPALPGPIVFRAPAPKPAGTAGATPAPAAPPQTMDLTKRETIPPFIARFLFPNPIWVLTADGMLRRLQQSDASDQAAPRQFVAPGLKALPLNIAEETLYTATRAGCGEEGAVWSINSEHADAAPKSFKLGADVAGLGGVSLGSKGAIFVQTLEGPFDPVNGKYAGAVLSLTKDLTLSKYFVLPAAEGKKSAGMNATSPMVVTFKGQELVVTANVDGRLYVLRGSSLGGEDHHRYLSRSMVLPTLDGKTEHGIWGGLSSWEDTDGTRYVLAPVWGPLSKDLQLAIKSTHASNGSVVAFKFGEDTNGAPTLTPAWVSRDLDLPVTPVIAKGVVFALSSGKFSSGTKPEKKAHATLYGLDGVTGEEMYSTRDQVKAAGNLTGLTIANGRIYFLTMDNVLQAFGKYLEH